MRRKLTYEFCKEEVSKYNSYSELYQNDVSILMKIKQKGWDELISHWELPFTKSNLKWTYERCKEEVSKMTYLNELQGTTVVNVLRKNGWFDELTSHLIRVVNKPYTKEDCIKEAKKYNRRVDFQKKSNGQYSKAINK